MTLKQKLNSAKAALGREKADALIKRLEAEIGHFPTLKQQLDAIGKPAIESRRGPPPSSGTTASPAIGSGQIRVDRDTTRTVSELIAHYDSLGSDPERRAFFRANEKALSNPTAKVPGLVLVCMSAANPLSARARFQLVEANKTTVLTKAEWRALSPYDRGTFIARGGKIVPETMKRSLFQRLSPRDRSQFCSDGGVITDD